MAHHLINPNYSYNKHLIILYKIKMDFEKLTIKAQEAVQAAQQLAIEHEHQAIECGHLLEGIFQVDDNVIPHLFQKI